MSSFLLRFLRVLSFYPLLVLVSAQQAQSPFLASPFPPSAVPLAVVHPYFSTWLLNGSVPLNGDWSRFATRNYVTGWAGYVRVDGQAYRFLGNSPGGEVAVQTGLSLTPTRSTFTFTAGPVNLTVEFLTPIEPTSLLNQSRPFSYLTIAVKGDQAHQVEVYSDISGEWIAGDTTLKELWDLNTNASCFIHEIGLQSPQPYSEQSDRAHFYYSYYATQQGQGVTYQSGQDIVVRGQFINMGVLQNSQDNNFREIGDRFPVFAFAFDLGQVSDTTNSPTVIAIGLAPQADGGALQYVQSDNSLEDRFLYYLSEKNTEDAIREFVTDYPNAKIRATAFDTMVANDAGKISAEYADLVALATRQAFGAIQITISRDASGNWNTSDVLTFMKEISSSGLVNTIDVIYPSMPIFLYTNPDILATLLEPTLRYMETPLYGNSFVPHDLGRYPIANGVNTPNQPLEESANMLIMALAAARASGDGNLLHNHHQTLLGVADYLVANTLIPNSQPSTDDFLGAQANTSNLALKGIIALKAMQEIQTALNITGNTTYSDTATNYINQWTQLAVNNGTNGETPRVLSQYGNLQSFALPYNLYADQLLGTNLVPSFVYQVAEEYVTNPNSSSTFGVTLDSRQSNNTKSDWTLFTAAALNSQSTTARDMLINMVHKYAAAGVTPNPFPDYYNIETAQQQAGFQARPVQGAMYSLLALNLPVKPITLPPTPPSPSNSGPGSTQSPSGQGSGGRGSGTSLQISTLSSTFMAGLAILLTL